MQDKIIKQAEDRMHKSVEALHKELAKLRTGRAHPSLLDHIKVSCYGSESPLSQVASITVDDPRTLLVSAWDKSVMASIEKAIRQSDLGLNPATAGNAIRVPLPPLTEERRKDLVRIVRDEGEKARVGIRNARRDANNELKDLVKEKEISEDDERRALATIQKVTDKNIAEVDSILSAKETELMAV